MARILVVDDEKSIRISISEFLKDDGHDVQVAEDAITALELLKEDFDIVVTDIIMPKLSGIKLLAAIRQVSKHVQVIMITGEPTHETASDALRLGAFDYLAKPVTKEAIVKTVNNAARSKALIDEKLRLEEENLNYRNNLEQLVVERTGALLESEERFRSVVENSHEGMLIVNDAYQFEYVNDELTRILGYPREEIIGQDFRRFLDEESREIVTDRYLWRQKGEKVPPRYEFNVLQKDGEKRRVETSSAVIKNKAGKNITISQILDITERKRAEEALRESEAILDAFFRSSPAGMNLIDNQLRYVKVNRLAQERIGLSLEEIIGKPLHEVVPKFADGIVPGFQKILMTGQKDLNVEVSGELPSKPGEIMHWLSHHFPITMPDGKIWGIGVVATDITERKQAEEEQQESEKRYHQFFEDDLTGDYIATPDGKFLACNPAFVRMFGFKSMEEALATPVSSLYPEPKDRIGLLDILKKKKKLEFYELDLRHQDGRILHIIENTVGKFNEKGELIEIKGYLIDNTRRKEAENELRESEENLRMVVEASLDAILAVDENAEIVLFNQSAEELFQYSQEDVINKPVKILLRETQAQSHQVRLEKFLGTGVGRCGHIGRRMERMFKRKNGTVFNAEVAMSGGRANGSRLIVVSIHDITERKRAEAALLKSEENYRTIVESTNACLFRTDRRGRFTYANEAAYQTLGYTKEELIGKFYLKFVHPEDKNYTHELFHKQISTGVDTVKVEFRFINKNGSVGWFMFNVNPVLENKQIAGLTGIGQDITDHKRAEKALRESEEMFRNVIEQSGDGIYILYEDRFDLINSRFTEIFGVTHEETKTLDFNFLDLVAPESKAEIINRAELRKCGETPPSHYEFVAFGKDHNLINVESSVAEISYRGGVAVLGIIRDVTERKRLEAQFHQSQKMESVGRLAGGVAHDFNNLLTVISGYSQLAAMNLDERDPTQLDIVEIQKASNQAADLTRQLLAFSRKQKLKPKVLNLNNIITNLNKMLHRMIGEDIEILMIPDQELWNVKIDPGQIEQVIINLAVNARDAMPDGGRLTIGTQNTVLDVDYSDIYGEIHAGKHILLTVTDTGVGMSEAVKTQIFDPFFTTKAEGKGTGLGLSTVFGIVMQSGGGIDVQTRV